MDSRRFMTGLGIGMVAGGAVGMMVSRGMRRSDGKAVFVAANLTDKAASFPVKGLSPNADKPLLAENGQVSADGAVSLGPWGFVVVAVK